MHTLNELIGRRVIIEMEGLREEDIHEMECIVTGVDINEFYFEEKGEPILIHVNVIPVDNLPKDYIDLLIEEFPGGVPLDKIRKAY